MPPSIILVMGVVGSGKTTIGRLLAQQLGREFADADSFHSAENVEKIRQGIALTDADRAPWLRALRDAILTWIAERKNVVLACSALKQKYREELLLSPEVKLVYLKGSRELILSRLRARHGHFATEKLLASQLETLEEPEDAVSVDVSGAPEKIVAEIRKKLGLR
jgi:gluconokinase